MTRNKAPDAASTRSQQESGRVIRAISFGVGPVAAAFAAAGLRPVFGTALLTAELVFVLMVFMIAVFGAQQHVDRVFRLLRWLRNCPEPPAPETLDADNLPRIPVHRPLRTSDAMKVRQSAKSSADHSGV